MCRSCQGRVPGMQARKSWDYPDDIWTYLVHPWHSRREPNGCLVWICATHPSGYGQVWVPPELERVHVLAYNLRVGPLTDNLDVLHTCDNPPCFEPSHLFLGDASANMQDAITKGRHNLVIRRGEHHGRAKLSWDQVCEIRRAYAAGEMNQYALARLYNVHQSVIWSIIHWHIWRTAAETVSGRSS